MVRSLRKSQELIWRQSRVVEGRWVEEEARELQLYRVLTHFRQQFCAGTSEMRVLLAC